MRRLLATPAIEWTLKLLLAAAVLWAVWVQAFKGKDLDRLWAVFVAHLSWQQLPCLLGCILLMPVNWLLEAAKWHQLVRPFMPIRRLQALKAVLAGVSVSIFTPNRVGEYAGRILMVAPEYNLRAVIATLVGSFAQNVVLLTAGLGGGLWFALYFLDTPRYLAEAIATLGLLFLALLLLVYFHIDLARPLARRLPWPERLRGWLRQLNVLERYDTATLARALGIATVRYVVFSTQYVLMVWFYGIEVGYLAALASVATVFLLQMGVPLPPLVARGSIALFVWGYHTDNHLGILAASYSVFVLNLALPALAGLAIILSANILKSLGYD